MRLRYDAQGRPSTVEDADGRALAEIVYDAQGRAIEVRAPDGSVLARAEPADPAAGGDGPAYDDLPLLPIVGRSNAFQDGMWTLGGPFSTLPPIVAGGGTLEALGGLNPGTRVLGLVQAVAGLGEAAVGATLMVGGSETGVLIVVGGAIALHGSDVFAAGLTQLWTGQSQATLTQQLLIAAGLDPATAALLDAGLSMTSGVVLVAVGPARAAAAGAAAATGAGGAVGAADDAARAVVSLPDTHGVFFFGDDILPLVNQSGATLNAPGKMQFFMPVADAAHIGSVADAARFSGGARSITRAYTSGAQGYGVAIPLGSLPIRLPTAVDAGGFAHFLSGGRTALRLAGQDGAFLLNGIREFVTVGGIPMPKGAVLFRIGDQGEWVILRRF